ncbi:MAG: OadG family protein [Bacteroidetes bacterium]|nr:OadG family protein [Bacteroidota bacterium]
MCLLNNLLLITNQGYIIAAVGWSIVFFALIILVIVFDNIPKLINIKIKRNIFKTTQKEVSPDEDLSMPADVSAAISMALYLYDNEIHDEEFHVITIKHAAKTYSPWSSKIYGVTNLPQR